MIKISWNNILNAVNFTSGFIHVPRILAQIGDTYKWVHRKNTEKVHIKLLHNFRAIPEFPECLKHSWIRIQAFHVYTIHSGFSLLHFTFCHEIIHASSKRSTYNLYRECKLSIKKGGGGAFTVFAYLLSKDNYVYDHFIYFHLFTTYLAVQCSIVSFR